MIKIKLPIQEKEIKDDKFFVKESEKEFFVDMSLEAETRFNTNFPEIAETTDFIEYTKRVSSWKGEKSSVLRGNLNCIYCWLETELTCKQFLQMFDFADKEYIEKLGAKIKKVFDLILNSSAEKN